MNKNNDKDILLSQEMLKLIKTTGFKVGSSGMDEVLIEQAIRSASRAEEASSSGKFKIERGETASAILCSAGAVESRVSEYITHYEFASGELPGALLEIRSERDALAQWRRLLKHTNPSFDMGTSREYAQLGCLLRLRDLVAHRNARLQNFSDVPEHISDCVRQGVIPINAEQAEWTRMTLISAVAKWSSETAENWLKIAEELIPLRC